MTELEARDLKVGDMIIFYDDSDEIEPGHTYFTTVVDGKTHAADLGLIVRRNGDQVGIDWLAHDGGTSAADVHYGWEQIEKV